ncbi:DUF4391 domain-containing protein [Pontibacter ramchanderi]|uniref:DUF4391 domain-containing protein n=1 Tax=Pontibacter ramchanderi TaxID=1179743 RepID=UPI0015D61C66|nr:DUF4391 domain-containing protein [Pontibacter ramchanderi]
MSKLNIPEACLIDQRIPKSSIVAGAELGTADKKLLQDEVQEVRWLAAFKPNNAAIPAFADALYLYNEVHYILLELKGEAKYKKVAELLQKVMPYPLVLWIVAQDKLCVCTADKRINQNDTAKRTIESLTFAPWLQLPLSGDINLPFVESLATEMLPQYSLKAFYQGITTRIFNLQAAQLSGTYTIKNADSTRQDVEVLAELRRLADEISRLKKEIKSSTAFGEQVTLHIQLKKLQEQQEQLQQAMQ